MHHSFISAHKTLPFKNDTMHKNASNPMPTCRDHVPHPLLFKRNKPHAFDKKTQNFAQGLDFLRILARSETLDIPRWLYTQCFMRNPNLRSKKNKFQSQEGKDQKTEFQGLISYLKLYYLLHWVYGLQVCVLFWRLFTVFQCCFTDLNAFNYI